MAGAAVNGNSSQVHENNMSDIDDIKETIFRRRMLLLHGIKEENHEDATEVVIYLIRYYLQFPEFSKKMIIFSRRMGVPSYLKPTRSILFALNDIEVRDRIFFNKSLLKYTGLAITEFLTKKRYSLLQDARCRFGDGNCWSRDGYICIQYPKGIRHRITTSIELSKIGRVKRGGKRRAYRKRRNATNPDQ